MWYKNIAGRFFGLVTKHACDRRTDRRTDGQNYDSQDRASIAASRGKNGWNITIFYRQGKPQDKLSALHLLSGKFFGLSVTGCTDMHEIWFALPCQISSWLVLLCVAWACKLW